MLLQQIVSGKQMQMDSVFNNAQRTISFLWAASVWNERTRLWQRMQEFAKERNISHLPLGMQAVAYVSSKTNCETSTRMKYCSNLRSLLHRMGVETPLLDLYANALPTSGSLLPVQQATPCPKDLAYTLMEHALSTLQSKPMAAAIYIVWKTASRWSDILGLTGASLVECNNNFTELILQWGVTKTNRAQDFRATSWTVIEELHRPDLLRNAAEVLRSLKPSEPLIDCSTEKFRRLLRLHPTANDLNLSAHSFKRGAADVLFLAAAEGRLEPRLAVLLLKHKDKLHEFPSATLRYVNSKRNLALTLGSQHATRLL